MVYPAVGPSFLEPLPSRQQYAPTYGAIFDSLSRMENLVGQGAFNLGLHLNRDSTPDENFDPYETVWGTKYENSMGAFTKAQNQLDVELIKQRMEQGQQDRETVFQAGGKAIAPMFLVGNLDPTILLPVGATLKGATTAGTFFKNAARVGAATGAAVGVQEAGLHYLQDFRTREETVGAITASVILGGMLGGAASLWSGKAFKAAADNVYRETADADTLSKLIREAEEQGQFQHRDRTFADTGQFRARKELDELAEGFDVGEKWTDLQLKADYYDQSYDLGISHDGVLNTPERILDQILPKQQAKNASSILLPETLLKIRKQANKPLTQPSLAETNVDLLGDPSIKFTGLDYLEAEFESYAKMKLSTDEVDEIITGLLDRGVSRDEIKDIAKRVLRKSVGQKQKPKSTGLLVEDELKELQKTFPGLKQVPKPPEGNPSFTLKMLASIADKHNIKVKIQDIKKTLGKNVDLGRMTNVTKLKEGKTERTLSAIPSMYVMAHEIGHQIHRNALKYPSLSSTQKIELQNSARAFLKRSKKDIEAITGQEFQGLKNKFTDNELVANTIGLYLTDPKVALDASPGFFRKYKKIIDEFI